MNRNAVLVGVGALALAMLSLLVLQEARYQQAQAAKVAAEATQVSIANNVAIAKATATQEAADAQATAVEGQTDAQTTATAHAQATQTAVTASRCAFGFGGFDMQIQVTGGDAAQACQYLKQHGGSVTATNKGGSVFLIPGVNPNLDLVCSSKDHGGVVSVYDMDPHVMGKYFCSHIGQPGF